MKLGVFTPLLSDKPLDEALALLSDLGVTMVELGAGGYPGHAHANPDILLHDDQQLSKFKQTLNTYNMGISALSCHGNAVHPDKEVAEAFHQAFEKTVLLAEKLGIHQINTFSGCPGGSKDDKTPNWVTCPWPEDYTHVLEYQWTEVLIPYWKKATTFAKAHGVDKIALEMHPGFCVYNPYTLLKLRDAVGPEIGANFDPSHLIWQGINPVAAIRELKDAIFHFHAKDTKIDGLNCGVNGVLDVRHYDNELERSWVFRTVGYGNDYETWKEIISTLRMIDYDYVVSIEHEDSLMSVNEGLTKAVNFLKEVMIFEESGDMFWA
ncbi:sugar phosphate isomerase/epimerase [Vallitalea pronyensis]|uniref:Sugar phosphate isomerase/epimerase n=1 Tax=Vallitalea pronyensis TaxID=1348613 RepID=A0A8J8MHH5_9FIRM|nr:sugar phosphate isomerase/epimerase [Vallitalea pronyensis]QUI21526.1 sugar phosphate isomerase/epimerase [Vallitalea pronyensis]